MENDAIQKPDKMNADVSGFFKTEGRALPVFLLVDVSGSMAGPKIETVNRAIKEMIGQFRNIENPKGIIKLSIISFGNGACRVIRDLAPLNDSDVYDLSANGDTPMGMSFEQLVSMIENPGIVSRRDYTPTVVLISDGNPTDYNVYGMSVDEIKRWPSMEKVHSSPRTSKAIRLAMGIGDDMNLDLLKAFVNNEQIPIILATNTDTISKFFQWVTMSVSVRSVSNNPNAVSVPSTSNIFEKDEVEF